MNINSINNFLNNLEDLDKFLKNFKSKIKNKKIAVVGSSRNLKNRNLGKKIDKFDLIARFNLAPTKGFEKDVGSRTDIIVTNHLYFVGKRFNKFHMDINSLRKKLIIIIVDHHIADHENFLKKNRFKFVHRSNRIIFFNNKLNGVLRFKMVSNYNLFKKIFFYYKIQKYSGGMILTSLLYLLKANFKNFGFDLNKTQEKVDYYYKKSGTNKKKLKAQHNFPKESEILRKIIKSA